MEILRKLERKYGRYAIRNLSLYMVIAYAIGYTILMINPTLIFYLNLEPYYILKGQIWRLITWVIVPYGMRIDLFTLIMLYFYYSVGQALERTWGSFRYNVYIFSGILINIIGAFLLYFINRELMWLSFNTYYLNMTILLAFAATYPDEMVLLYFFIPLKMKWLGIFDAAYLIYIFLQSGTITKYVMFVSMLNFIIYFIGSRRKGAYRRSNKKIIYGFNQAKKEQEEKLKRQETTRTKNQVITRHKCAVCGRTELDNPDLEFRFCSKCDGNYEYCMDHIYTHQHFVKQ